MSYLRINSVVNELDSFIKSNQHIIHETHFLEAMEHIDLVERLNKDDFVMSWNGFHFLNCGSNASLKLWNDESDTCGCYQLKTSINKIKRIVIFYRKILGE